MKKGHGVGWGRVSRVACCLGLIFRLTTHAGQSLPSLGLEKLLEIIEMSFPSPHPIPSLTFIPKTLVLKIFQGGASRVRTTLGVGMWEKEDAEAHVPNAQLRLEILRGPLEEA